MTYYKIILNLEIIGVSTSNSCKCFQAKHQMLERTSAELAEYIECAGKLYHGAWMQPIKTDLYLYQLADIIAIGEQEYNILAPAVDTAPIPIEIVPEPINIDDLPNPADEVTLEYVRTSKIAEMSATCRKTIEQGFDIIIRDKTSHFSLTTEDQLNLANLSEMAKTQDLIPYHADGESVIFYTKEEFNSIVSAANSLKIYQTTYYNALKDYINSLETIEEIAAIYYGINIPEEFKTEVLKVLEYN